MVGSEDPKHLRHGVDHKVLDSLRAIGAYVSKYVAKAQAGSGQEVGCCWGMFGELETAPYLEAESTASEYVLLRRLARRWLKSRKSKHGRRLSDAEVCTVFALGAESTPFMTVLRMLEAATGDDYVAPYASTEL